MICAPENFLPSPRCRSDRIGEVPRSEPSQGLAETIYLARDRAGVGANLDRHGFRVLQIDGSSLVGIPRLVWKLLDEFERCTLIPDEDHQSKERKTEER